MRVRWNAYRQGYTFLAARVWQPSLRGRGGSGGLAEHDHRGDSEEYSEEQQDHGEHRRVHPGDCLVTHWHPRAASFLGRRSIYSRTSERN